MVVYTDAHTLQPLAEGDGTGLPVVLGDDHRTDLQSTVHKLATQAKHIHVVGNAQVATHLVLLDVARTDSDDDFGIVAQLHQHLQLAVGFKTREDTTGVVVVE